MMMLLLRIKCLVFFVSHGIKKVHSWSIHRKCCVCFAHLSSFGEPIPRARILLLAASSRYKNKSVVWSLETHITSSKNEHPARMSILELSQSKECPSCCAKTLGEWTLTATMHTPKFPSETCFQTILGTSKFKCHNISRRKFQYLWQIKVMMMTTKKMLLLKQMIKDTCVSKGQMCAQVLQHWSSNKYSRAAICDFARVSLMWSQQCKKHVVVVKRKRHTELQQELHDVYCSSAAPPC